MSRAFPSVEHVAWQVADPAAVAKWYGEQFGFSILRKLDGPANAHFLVDHAGKVVVEIYNNPKASVPDYFALNPLHLHLAFAVADPTMTRDQLLHAGASVVDDLVKLPNGDELVMMRDPWGFAIQLCKRGTPMI